MQETVKWVLAFKKWFIYWKNHFKRLKRSNQTRKASLALSPREPFCLTKNLSYMKYPPTAVIVNTRIPPMIVAVFFPFIFGLVARVKFRYPGSFYTCEFGHMYCPCGQFICLLFQFYFFITSRFTGFRIFKTCVFFSVTAVFI